MPVNFTCPHCGKSMTVADQYVGQTGPCSACGNEIHITPDKASVAAQVPAKPSTRGRSAVPIVVAVVLTAGFAFLVCGGILVALLLPAVQVAREADRRAQCNNNLKLISLAMQEYHAVHQSLPSAYTVDDEGQPLHSWRTLLLPHLEHNGLYDKIALDEPWDSPSNQQFHDRLVAVYQCPSSPQGQTSYMVITGPGTMFPGSETVQFREVLDGLANTIMVIETTGDSVNWMSPTDLSLQKLSLRINDAPQGGIASRHPGGAQAAMGDGTVRFFAEHVDQETLRKLITIADGQVVESTDVGHEH